MNKFTITIVSLLIGFYAGIAYYGYTHQDNKEQLDRIEENVAIIAKQLQIDIIEFN